jgi:hypothetical protein
VYIDHLTEYNILQTLLQKLPKVNPLDTVILNVSPDYSSTVAMQIAHYLSDKGHMVITDYYSQSSTVNHL